MQKIKNIVNYEPENLSEFLFEQDTISIKGQPDSYDFSMVIAMYNSEKYIGETLDSLINQDFGFEKIQVVVVDDGSKDSSFEVVKAYAEKYPNNIILVHKANGGVSSARNVGMRFVKGQYINFIDSDDLLGANVCSKVFEFFEKYKNKTDVVTIKTELFGAKTGDTWFNKKFAKGDRLIDLWKDPKIYLNSVSFTFFHSRIKNQLVFDETISISEDLKVVNSVLMNKWTIGVLASCKYLYRIHNAEEASLSSSARRKPDWYFKYLDRVYFWLYNKGFSQASCFPEYLQHTLFRDLYNRFVENTQCVTVLNSKELVEYKKQLFKALSLIDDKVIRSVDCINTDYQVYFYSIKYGAPTMTTEGALIDFYWKEPDLHVKKKLCVMYENCEIKNKNAILEGYLCVNNVRANFKDSNFKFYVDGVGEISPEIYKNTNNDKLAFDDEFVFFRKYFKVSIPLKNVKNTAIRVYLKHKNQELPFNYAGQCRWCGVSADIPYQYYHENKYMLYFKDRQLFVKKSGCFDKLKAEVKYLLYLKKQGKTNEVYKKGFKVRLAYHLNKLFKFRPIWIVSDRVVSAGDNGEAFYEFLRKKKHINSYFAIAKDTADYKRLKKKGFKVLDVESRKYKMKFLNADVLVSAHFENKQLTPISNKFIPDIVQKKKHIFLQHGIIKDDLSSIYSKKMQKLDMFVTSAKPEYESIVNTQMYFCDKSITKLTGLPRYDKLYNSPEKIVLVIPTWRRGLVTSMDHTTETWNYKPNFENSYFYKFYRELLTNEELKNYLKEKGYKIYYFPHDNLLPTNHYFKDIQDVHVVEGSERNYTKFFAESSIMVTDYSSTAFDFGYLRKPIIFCQGDFEEFFGSHTYSKGYFDYKRDAFGDVVENVQDTIKKIKALVDNNCALEEKYAERINKFFPYSDQNNSKRVYAEIKNILRRTK